MVRCPRCGDRIRLPAASSRGDDEIDDSDGAFVSEARPWLGPSHRYDDDRDPEPSSYPRRARRRKRQAGPSAGLWIAIGGLGAGLAALIVLAIVLLVSRGSDSKDDPPEAGRHSEPAGNFSYVPPRGWNVKDFGGLKFKVVIGPPAEGFAPNMNFIAEANPLPLDACVDGTVAQLQQVFANFRLIDRQAFTTRAGLKGHKIIYENQQNNRRLRQCQYFFDLGREKLVITATALASAGGQHDAVFDECVKTFKTGR
jgi:hypothetical protein